MLSQGTLFQECQHKQTGVVPTPETEQRHLDNQVILTALSKLQLPSWERQFVRDVVTHKRITPKQQATLLELRDRFLGKEKIP